MNADWMITAFVLIDTLMEELEHRSHVLADVPDSDVILIAVVAATYVHNHHERAVGVLREGRYRSGHIHVSRFNRRLHKLADWLACIPTTRGELFTTGDVFVIDSMPVPVCRRARARRGRKVRGIDYGGYGAAKKETFFGGRLHRIGRPDGVPVRFVVLPARLHDLTLIHERADELPEGTRLFDDKAFNSARDAASIEAETGVRLVPIRKANRQPHAWFLDERELREYRHTIETVNSQLEKTGVERLYARTNGGIDLKIHAALIAVTITNIN